MHGSGSTHFEVKRNQAKHKRFEVLYKVIQIAKSVRVLALLDFEERPKL